MNTLPNRSDRRFILILNGRAVRYRSCDIQVTSDNPYTVRLFVHAYDSVIRVYRASSTTTTTRPSGRQMLVVPDAVLESERPVKAAELATKLGHVWFGQHAPVPHDSVITMPKR